MSGIAGIVRWDGGRTSAGEIESMTAALSHRGPDGRHSFELGAARLAHLMLRVDETTPGPARADDVALVVDGRIDNLDFLRRCLGRNGTCLLERTEDVLLAAYRRWGPGFPRWVLGDFAMALWDSSVERLLLIRDAIGVKSLYYHRNEHRIVFASEIKGVLAAASVPCLPCRSLLEEYDRDCFRSRERTFFARILRVLPAEIVRVEKGRWRRETYWHPRCGEPLRGIGHASHLRRFRRLFEEAVACRLPRSGRAAVALSGGLDSSSVTVVAANSIRSGRSRAELRPSSEVIGTFPNERFFFEAVWERSQVQGRVRDANGIALAPYLAALARELEMPFIDVIDANLYHGICRSAAEDGARVLLMGVWGDDLMAGVAYLGDLMRAGRWLELRREWRAWKKAGLDRLALRRSLRFLLFPNPDGPVYPTCNQRELQTLISRPYQGLILESLDKGAAAQGVEIRFPSLDRRLIDFAFALPAEERVRGGVGKRLLREGLRDLLPEVVAQRKDKGEYTSFWHSKLLEAGETGTWDECVIGWKKRARTAWEETWFGRRSV